MLASYRGPYRIRIVDKPISEIEHPRDAIVRVMALQPGRLHPENQHSRWMHRDSRDFLADAVTKSLNFSDSHSTFQGSGHV